MTLARGKTGVQTRLVKLQAWATRTGTSLEDYPPRAIQRLVNLIPRVSWVSDPCSKSTAEFRNILGPGCVSLGKLR